MDKRITTLDELIDLVAWGDIHEGAHYYRDEPEPEYPAVQLPWLKDEPSTDSEIAIWDECRTDFLTILIAFKEGRISSGGHVLPKATPTTTPETTTP